MEYEDKTIKSYELGTKFGAAAGLTIPHVIVTGLEEGDTFDSGDAISYNSGHFEPDSFNPKTVCYKNNFNVKTVLWESYQTLEDACSISRRVSDKLTTSVAKSKNIVVNFDQSVTNLASIGMEVEFDTVLCFIEDATTASSGLFNAQTIDTLRMLSAQAPKASAKGVVAKIEVFYHGEPEDASESIQKLIEESDKRLAKERKEMGKTVLTGSVDESFRIDGDSIPLDSVCIRVYITSNLPSGIGDRIAYLLS